MKTRQLLSVLFVLTILTFTQTQAMAGFYSGNDLIALMREYDKAETNQKGVAWGRVYEFGTYIIGVYDATESLYNVPLGANKGQIIAVVSNYLKNHPEEWTKPVSSLVVKALKEAFPLKESK